MSDFPASSFQLTGEPGLIAASGAQYGAFGSAASDSAGQIRSLDTSLFIGPEGDEYRKGLNESLPPHLETTGAAFTKVASALSTFSTALSGLQDRMRPLAAQAPGLWQAVQTAQGQVNSAKAADAAHAQAQAKAKAALKPGQTLPADTYQSASGSAAGSLSSAQQAWTNCLNAAGQVKSDLQTAINACDHQIHEASGMRFHKNPSGWGAFFGGIKSFVKDHVAGLAKLSGILKTISGITGMLSFIPVVGEAFLAVSVVTGGAALAIDATTMWATGKWSATTLAVDGLALLPAAGKIAGKAVDAMGATKVLGDGEVVLKVPKGATSEEISQMQEYADAGNRALKQGDLSPTGRVPVNGELKVAKERAAAVERTRAQNAGTPYGSNHAAHLPDTTWSGKAEPPGGWGSHTPRVNTSIGSQSAKYPVGYKPTGFRVQLPPDN